MTRVEFLNQLDYLLQDVDEKDRQDALDYYRDYMDEAGIYDYDLVDDLLESPEKIAISLRVSLNGSEDEQIESGEQGFKSAHAETSGRVPEVYENYRKGHGDGIHDASWTYASEENGEQEIILTDDEEKKSSLGKILLLVALGIVCLPVILGIGGGLIGLVFGLFGTIIGLVFGIAGGALGSLVGGVVLFTMSIVRMVTSIPQGVFMMGISLLLIAAGILLVMATVAICKRFIPWLIRSIVNIGRRIFHKNGGVRA